jgi:hypothetical protein
MSKPKNLDELIERQTPKLEDLDIDSDDLSMQRLVKKLEALRYLSDTSDRKWLAIWTALIVTIWLAAVLFILIFNERLHFCLNTTELVALLGTTTLNVLGLSFIVLRGHFQSTSKQ